MEDTKIIELYWQRDERALQETADRYGSYCMKISMNILADESDSEENVNDTYLNTWNSIPPTRPESLIAYLGKVCRNLALNRYKARNTQKRGGGELALSLDELSGIIPDISTVEDAVEGKALSEAISAFLWQQKPEMRRVFVWRYFYCESVEEVAKRFSISESKVKSILFRLRNKLRIYLESEGFPFEA